MSPQYYMCNPKQKFNERFCIVLKGREKGRDRNNLINERKYKKTFIIN